MATLEEVISKEGARIAKIIEKTVSDLKSHPHSRNTQARNIYRYLARVAQRSPDDSRLVMNAKFTKDPQVDGVYYSGRTFDIEDDKTGKFLGYGLEFDIDHILDNSSVTRIFEALDTIYHEFQHVDGVPGGAGELTAHRRTFEYATWLRQRGIMPKDTFIYLKMKNREQMEHYGAD